MHPASPASLLPDLRHNPALPAPHWPLFDAYPDLTTLLQPLPLCALPSPVEPLPTLGTHAWVKRDDAIHPQYGGNKMRKLEFVASELLRQGPTAGLTLDSTYSGKAFAEYLKRLKQSHSPLLYWATLNSQHVNAQ